MSLLNKFGRVFMSFVLVVSLSFVSLVGGGETREAYAASTNNFYYNVARNDNPTWVSGMTIYLGNYSKGDITDALYQSSTFGFDAEVTYQGTTSTYSNKTGYTVRWVQKDSSFDSCQPGILVRVQSPYWDYYCSGGGVTGINNGARYYIYTVQGANVASIDISGMSTPSNAGGSYPASYTVDMTNLVVTPKDSNGNTLTNNSTGATVTLKSSLYTVNDNSLSYSASSATSFTIDGAIKVTSSMSGASANEYVYTDYVLGAFDTLVAQQYTDSFYSNYFSAQKEQIKAALATARASLAKATTQAQINSAISTLNSAVNSVKQGADAYKESYEALSNKAAITDADITNLQTAISDYSKLNDAGQSTCATIYTNLNNQLAAAQWDQAYGEAIDQTAIDTTSAVSLELEISVIDAALAAYNGTSEESEAKNLTADQQKYVSAQKAALDAQRAAAEFYKDNYDSITASTISLPADADAAATLISDLTAVQTAYNGLSSAAQTFVTNADGDIVTQLQAQIDAATFMKDYVALLNKSADDYTTSDLEALEAAVSACNALSAEAKAMLSSDVTDKLGYATAARSFMDTYASGEEGDNNIVNQSTVTDADLDRTAGIEAAITAYNALNAEQKKMVGGQTTLEALTAKKTSAEWYETYAAVIGADTTDALTADERTAAKAAYAAMTDDIGTYIDSRVKTALQNKYYAAKFIDDNAELIAKTTVTTGDATAIAATIAELNSAIAAYKDLSADAKLYADGGSMDQSGNVSNSSTITALNNQLAAATYLQTYADLFTKTSYTTDDLATLRAAKEALDALDPAVAALLDETVATKIGYLTKVEAFITAYETEGDTTNIVGQSTVDDSDLTNITGALSAYDDMNDFEKALVGGDTTKTALDTKQAAANWYKNNKTILERTTDSGALTEAERTSVTSASDTFAELSEAQQAVIATAVQTDLANKKDTVDYINSNGTLINGTGVAYKTTGEGAAATTVVNPSSTDLQDAIDAYNALGSTRQAFADGGIDGTTNTSTVLTSLNNQKTVATFLEKYQSVLSKDASKLTASEQATLQAASAEYAAMSETLQGYLPSDVKNTIALSNSANTWSSTYSAIINKTPVNDADLATINAALAALEGLDDNAQKLVSQDVKDALAAKQAAATWYTNNKSVADRGTAAGALSDTERTAVNTASEALSSLTDAQKGYLSSDVITNVNNQKAAADYLAANETLINTSPVTAGSASDMTKTIEDLTAAVDAYNNLSEDQQIYADGGKDASETSTTLTKLNNQLTVANFLKDYADVLGVDASTLTSDQQAKLQQASAAYKTMIAEDGGNPALAALVPEAAKTTIAKSDAAVTWATTYKDIIEAATVTNDNLAGDDGIDAALIAYADLDDVTKALIASSVKTDLDNKKLVATWYDNNEAIIEATGQMTKDDKTAIDAALAYTVGKEETVTLTDDQKKLIPAAAVSDLTDKKAAADFLYNNDATLNNDSLTAVSASDLQKTIDNLNSIIASYNNLSEDQQAYVDGGKTGAGAEATSTTLTNLNNQVAAATFLKDYADLFTKDAYTVNDFDTLKAASEAYAQLSDDVKALLTSGDPENPTEVTTRLGYLDAVNTYNSTYKDIMDAETVTSADLDSQAGIEAAITALDNSNDFVKGLLNSNNELSTDLTNKKTAAEWYETNQTIIDKTGTLSESDYEAVNSAVSGYDSLTDAVKALVPSSVITNDEEAAANATLNNMKAAVDYMTASKTQREKETINAGDATAMATTIAAIQKQIDDYNALSATQKAYADGAATDPQGNVTGSSVLDGLNNQMTVAQFLADYADVFGKQASELTADDQARLAEASAAYKEMLDNATDEAQKNALAALVPETVKTTITKSDAAAEWAETYKDIIAAKTVTNDDLGDADGTGIIGALAAYDELDDATKALIASSVKDNLDNKKTAADWYAANESIIEKTGTVTTGDKEAIDKALDDFAKLDPAVQAQIDPSVATTDTDKQTGSTLYNKKQAADFLTDNNTTLNNDSLTAASAEDLQKTLDDLNSVIEKYNNLTEDQQAYVDGGKTGEGAEATSATLTNLNNQVAAATFLQDYADLFTKDAADFSKDDLATLKAASDAYSQLSDDVKALLTSGDPGNPTEVSKRLGYLDDVEAFNKAYATDGEGEDTGDILGQGTVTADDLDAIDSALVDYANLNDFQKQLVGGDAALENLLDKKTVAEWDKTYGDLMKKAADGTATADDLAQVREAMEAYKKMTPEQQANVNADSLNALKSVEGSAFTKTYLSDPETGDIYSKVDSNNYDQVISGADEWAKMSDEEKAAVNAALKEAGFTQTYDELITEAKNLKSAKEGFVKTYLTGEDGKIYSEVTADNYQSILAGKAAWDQMTQAERDDVNAVLKNETGKTFEEMLAGAEEASSNVDNFMSKYLVGDDGKVFTGVDANNFQQILSGKDAWDKLSQTEKDAINAILKSNAGMTYEEMLEASEKSEASASSFIDKYLTNKANGTIFNKVDSSNYKQILAAKAQWANLTQEERDAINAVLKAKTGKTFDELLAEAEAVEASMNKKTVTTTQKTIIPKTADDAPVAPIVLFTLSAVAIAAYSRRRVKQD